MSRLEICKKGLSVNFVTFFPTSLVCCRAINHEKNAVEMILGGLVFRINEFVYYVFVWDKSLDELSLSLIEGSLML